MFSVKETSQFYNVLKHGAFKSDPLQVIQQHLRNSLQVAAEEEKEKERKRQKQADMLNKSADHKEAAQQKAKAPAPAPAPTKESKKILHTRPAAGKIGKAKERKRGGKR